MSHPQLRHRLRSRPSPLTTTQQGYGHQWRKLRLTILTRDSYTCGYCGNHANTVDHIKPKADGGDDHPDNLIAACKSCNSRRERSGSTRNDDDATRHADSEPDPQGTAPSSRSTVECPQMGPTGALVD